MKTFVQRVLLRERQNMASSSSWRVIMSIVGWQACYNGVRAHAGGYPEQQLSFTCT